MTLDQLGWDSIRESAFESFKSEGLLPARVIEEHRERYIVFAQAGEKTAEVTGRLRFAASSRLDFPAVGDWVAVSATPHDDLAIIHHVLPRNSVFLRKVAGDTTDVQVVAANADVVFLVTDLALDFSIRRLERYLTLAHESGARPVFVLNKADLCEDRELKITEVQSIASGVPTLAVSAERGDGMAALMEFVPAGKSVALIGSSGVGKSTIINHLLSEERLKVQTVRASDGRGRHTTTSRQLILLPSGGMVIDTPGMREIQLWGSDSQLDGSFVDVEALAGQCRFSDCEHRSEPGCAVQKALSDGSLDQARWDSYRKLWRELRFLERKQDVRARLDEKSRWKKIHKQAQEILRRKYGN